MHNLVKVVIPMRDITVVEKVEASSTRVLPNAFVVSTKSKVCHLNILNLKILVAIISFTTTYIIKKVVLYSAVSSPLDRSKRFTLFAIPDRPVHSDTNSASPGSILARQQLRAKTKSLTFPPLSIATGQVLIYTAESTGASMERMIMPNLRNSSKGGLKPGLT